MVSANDKGKKAEEEDPQNPKEEEIFVGEEEDMEENKKPDTRATVASIGVVANPTKLRRTTRMSIGGKPPRLFYNPLSSPPCNTRPFHTLIHEYQYQHVPKGNLPSVWDMPHSNNVEKDHAKDEEWGKNNKNWDSRTDMIMNRIEQNSELIRTLTFEFEELKKLIEELIKITPPPPEE